MTGDVGFAPVTPRARVIQVRHHLCVELAGEMPVLFQQRRVSEGPSSSGQAAKVQGEGTRNPIPQHVLYWRFRYCEQVQGSFCQLPLSSASFFHNI